MKEGQPIPEENWKRISKVYDFILSHPETEQPKTEEAAPAVEKPVQPRLFDDTPGTVIFKRERSRKQAKSEIPSQF